MKDLDSFIVLDSDDILPYLLGECAETLDRQLEMLFRYSLEEGLVPREWKRASVVLNYKNGNRERKTVN